MTSTSRRVWPGIIESIFGIDADDIQTVNAQFETGTSIRTLISYAVGITLLIVSGFGIYNILNMMIYEKMDTIAILKAIGFRERMSIGYSSRLRLQLDLQGVL
jgi:ABC-type antimicrobial peptide transport system permease subunit